MSEVFPDVQPYHVYVPSFGEWGFMLASAKGPLLGQTPIRQVKGLQFYDFQLGKLTYFPADMIKKDVEINRLDNQILVRYFDEEWNKI